MVNREGESSQHHPNNEARESSGQTEQAMSYWDRLSKFSKKLAGWELNTANTPTDQYRTISEAQASLASYIDINSNIREARRQLKTVENLDPQSKANYKGTLADIEKEGQRLLKEGQRLLKEARSNLNAPSATDLARIGEALKELHSISQELLASLEKGDSTNFFPIREAPWQLQPRRDVLDYRRNFQDEQVPPDNTDGYLTDMLIGKEEDKRPGGVFFPIDGALIGRKGAWEIPERWLTNIETWVNQGIVVTCITGNRIQDVHEAFDNAGPRGIALKNRIEIFASNGQVQQGPKTDGIKKYTQEKAQDYEEPAKRVMKDISYHISKSKILKELNQKEHIPSEEIPIEGIPITFKELGGTILGRHSIDHLRDYIIERHKQDRTVNVADTTKKIYSELQRIVSKVLENHRDFIMVDTESSGLEILLNPDTTGIESHKGVALEAVVKAYQLSRIVVVIDDRRDLAMKYTAQSLTVDKKFRKNLEIMGSGNSIKMYNDSISRLEESDNMAIARTGDETEGEIEDILQEVNKIRASALKEMYKKLSSAAKTDLDDFPLTQTHLEKYVFIGVESSSGDTQKEVLEASDITVKGIDGTLDLVSDITRNIKKLRPDETLMQDCWHKIEDCQFDISKKLDNFKTEPSHKSMTELREALEELDNYTEYARTRVRPIASDFEEPLLDIDKSIRQLKQIFSASVLKKVSENLQASSAFLQTTVPIRDDNPTTLGKVLFDMPPKDVISRWGHDTTKAVQRIRDVICKSFDHRDTDDLTSTPFNYDDLGVTEATEGSEDIYITDDTGAAEETKEPPKSFRDRLLENLKAFTDTMEPHLGNNSSNMPLEDVASNMPLEDVASEWEKTIHSQRDSIYQPLAIDLRPTMQSFQDEISKHMLNFTKVMVPLHIHEALYSMPIKEVAVKWGPKYAQAVQLLRSEHAEIVLSTKKPEGIDDTKFAKSDTPILIKIRDQGVLETSNTVGEVTYRSQLNPEKGSVICEKSSSDKMEQAWEVWGHEILALGAEFNRLKATAKKYETFGTLTANFQALQDSTQGPEFQALAAQIQALQASAKASKLNALAAEEIGNRINFSTSRHILGLEMPELKPEWLETIEAMDLKTIDAMDLKTTEELGTEGINTEWLKNIQEMKKSKVNIGWIKVMKEMDKALIKDYPNMLQMNLTEITIPVDNETEDALKLFAPHVFESQADPKPYQAGSELHKMLLGTQNGQDIASLLSNVVPGRRVTEITPASDKIKFTLGPDPEFWFKRWKGLEWKQITGDENFTYQQIDADTLAKIDKEVGPNKRMEVEEKLREMPLQENLEKAKRDFDEAQKQLLEAQKQLLEAQLWAKRYETLVAYREKLEGTKKTSTAPSGDPQKGLWKKKPEPEPVLEKPKPEPELKKPKKEEKPRADQPRRYPKEFDETGMWQRKPEPERQDKGKGKQVDVDPDPEA